MNEHQPKAEILRVSSNGNGSGKYVTSAAVMILAGALLAWFAQNFATGIMSTQASQQSQINTIQRNLQAQTALLVVLAEKDGVPQGEINTLLGNASISATGN